MARTSFALVIVDGRIRQPTACLYDLSASGSSSILGPEYACWVAGIQADFRKSKRSMSFFVNIFWDTTIMPFPQSLVKAQPVYEVNSSTLPCCSRVHGHVCITPELVEGTILCNAARCRQGVEITKTPETSRRIISCNSLIIPLLVHIRL